MALSRGESTLVVQVFENGSTQWTATVQLNEGAEALQNDSRRSAIVSTALDRGRIAAEPVDITSQLEEQTLVVSHRDTGAATKRDGSIVFTRFHAADPPPGPGIGGGEGTVFPGADTVVLRAPDGYWVTGEYPGATVSKSEVRWHDNGTKDGIDRSTRVTFVNEKPSGQNAADAFPGGDQDDDRFAFRQSPAAIAMVALIVILIAASLSIRIRE